MRSKTLFITYDEKAVPKDIKKLYKGKNAPKPVFRAVISLPELNGFTLEDNVVLNTTEEFFGFLLSSSHLSLQLLGRVNSSDTSSAAAC